jgi:hypothetical protein
LNGAKTDEPKSFTLSVPVLKKRVCPISKDTGGPCLAKQKPTQCGREVPPTKVGANPELCDKAVVCTCN